MKFIFSFFVFLIMTSSAHAACDVKAVTDPVDGKIFFEKDHRLYGFLKASATTKTFCSTDEAEAEGYAQAPQTFSNSTARVVECIENSGSDCRGYVIGIYKSLDIYGKVCAAGAKGDEVIDAFVESAKSTNNLDIDKYYGTTNALLAAYPCKGAAKIARR